MISPVYRNYFIEFFLEFEPSLVRPLLVGMTLGWPHLMGLRVRLFRLKPVSGNYFTLLWVFGTYGK